MPILRIPSAPSSNSKSQWGANEPSCPQAAREHIRSPPARSAHPFESAPDRLASSRARAWLLGLVLLELADHLVVLDQEPVLGEEAEDLGEEVARLLVLVERRVAIRLESGAHGVGRLAQVVVRDLCEEQVVDHMAIGDVVVEVIDPQAKGTIDRLKRAAHIRPGALLDQV